MTFYELALAVSVSAAGVLVMCLLLIDAYVMRD